MSFGHDNDTTSLIRDRLSVGVLDHLVFAGLSMLPAANGRWKLLGVP